MTLLKRFLPGKKAIKDPCNNCKEDCAFVCDDKLDSNEAITELLKKKGVEG